MDSSLVGMIGQVGAVGYCATKVRPHAVHLPSMISLPQFAYKFLTTVMQLRVCFQFVISLYYSCLDFF